MRNPSTLTRRKPLGLGAALALATTATPTFAQAPWPDKPIKVIVPYAAGQGADVLMRLVAESLGKSLNQAFVVDNRAGAGGNIGTAAAAKAAPDGYTFLLGTNATNAANEFLYPTLGFDPAADFMPVAMIGLLPTAISTSSICRPTEYPSSWRVRVPSPAASTSACRARPRAWCSHSSARRHRRRCSR